MKRVALLGATGSIGNQALEIIGAHPELELVAAASGSQDIEGLAPLTQVGGDLTELLEQAEPDVVLNAVVGFAGLPATLLTQNRGKEQISALFENGVTVPIDGEEAAQRASALNQSLVTTVSELSRTTSARDKSIPRFAVCGKPRLRRLRRRTTCDMRRRASASK